MLKFREKSPINEKLFLGKVIYIPVNQQINKIYPLLID
jgi:hypothetical protein